MTGRRAGEVGEVLEAPSGGEQGADWPGTQLGTRSQFRSDHAGLAAASALPLPFPRSVLSSE